MRHVLRDIAAVILFFIIVAVLRCKGVNLWDMLNNDRP